MRLLIAAHDLYPDPGSGGTGRFVHETSKRLAQRGHDVTIVTRRRGDVPTREHLDGLRVIRYDLTIAGEPVWNIAPQIKPAISKLQDQLHDAPDPDALIFQATATAPILDALIPDKTPRLSVYHSPWPVEYAIKTRALGEMNPLRRRVNVLTRQRLEKRILNASDRVVVLSRYMAKTLENVHGPTADPRIVPGGVDATTFHPDAGPPTRLDGADPAFLTVRRLTPRMGHAPLLEAFATIADDHDGAGLFIAGQGPLEDRLKQRARDLGIDDRTHWLGYVPDDELPPLLASADVFMLPTQRLEGFGLATLEALASGTPAVGTPVGATPEILEALREHAPGQLPFLAASRDPDALADAMSAWSQMSPDVLEQASHASRTLAEKRYPWRVTTDALEATIEETTLPKEEPSP